jgi:hypothetical protein
MNCQTDSLNNDQRIAGFLWERKRWITSSLSIWIFVGKRDGITFLLAFIRSFSEADGFDQIGFSGVEPETKTGISQ